MSHGSRQSAIHGTSVRARINRPATATVCGGVVVMNASKRPVLSSFSAAGTTSASQGALASGRKSRCGASDARTASLRAVVGACRMRSPGNWRNDGPRYLTRWTTTSPGMRETEAGSSANHLASVGTSISTSMPSAGSRRENWIVRSTPPPLVGG